MTTTAVRQLSCHALCLPLTMAALLLCALFASAQADAQPPGAADAVSLTLPSSGEQVQGWSVKHGLLGRPVYDSAKGKQIGTVIDLVITQAATPYVLVIDASGSIGIGGHAVAVPRESFVEQAGQLILPGATRASLKTMPTFTYSHATMERARLVNATSVQLADAHARLVVLQRQAGMQAGPARVRLDQENATLQADIIAAENRLSDLENGHEPRLPQLTRAVELAMARVRAGMSHAKAQPVTVAPGVR